MFALVYKVIQSGLTIKTNMLGYRRDWVQTSAACCCSKHCPWIGGGENPSSPSEEQNSTGPRTEVRGEGDGETLLTKVHSVRFNRNCGAVCFGCQKSHCGTDQKQTGVRPLQRGRTASKWTHIPLDGGENIIQPTCIKYKKSDVRGVLPVK